ncbi:MCD, Malonyl-CoA decarboxylase MCD, partial [bacterium M00.F.Ca.ET.191.01.1.1]
AVLDAYDHLNEAGKMDFFLMLAESFGSDKSALLEAVDRWTEEETTGRATELHYRSEPRRQELLRRLNYAAGGTAALVKMRETLLGHLPSHPALRAVDRDFVHLFSSWFNRGF